MFIVTDTSGGGGGNFLKWGCTTKKWCPLTDKVNHFLANMKKKASSRKGGGCATPAPSPKVCHSAPALKSNIHDIQIMRDALPSPVLIKLQRNSP